MIKIKKYDEKYFKEWLKLMITLLPDYDKSELKETLPTIASSKRHRTYLALDKETVIGCVTVSIRTDYVEGASSSPTGYLEAIFIDEEFRKKDLAKKLATKGESWLKKKGCIEIGSDTWLWNKSSQKFHKKIGFKKEDELVHYIKKL